PRPGLVKTGMEKAPVPVTGFEENFSPIPRMAPPPLGREIEGTSIELDLVSPPSFWRNSFLLFCACSFIFDIGGFILRVHFLSLVEEGPYTGQGKVLILC